MSTTKLFYEICDQCVIEIGSLNSFYEFLLLGTNSELVLTSCMQNNVQITKKGAF